MKLLDVVKKLQSKGTSIKYRIRPDGGIVITEVEGVKFKAKKGNVFVRELSGVKLTEKQQNIINKNRRTLPVLSKTVQRKIAKAQRAWRSGTHGKQGKITTKRVRKNIELFGEEQALKSLEQQERYSKGYAYYENIDHLIDRLSGYLPDTEGLIAKIESKRDRFRDEWISDINDIFYAVDQGKKTLEAGIQEAFAIIK